MTRILLAVLAVVLLGCSATGDLGSPAKPIGNFTLGMVVPKAADEIQAGPLSRKATNEEWETAMDRAFQTRFTRYSGGKTYHIGVVVDGYILAQVGIPVVAAPKSVVLFRIIIVDAATQTVLNEPTALTAFESFSPGGVVSSGLANTREEQLADLADAAAKATETWMRKQPWFFDDQPPL